MRKKLLIVTQLSNITPDHKFVLEADSGWAMCMGRAREMLKLNSELYIDIMGPELGEGNDVRDYLSACQVKTHPYDVNPDLWEKYGDEGENRLRFIGHNIIPNALVTRYDFKWIDVVSALDLGMHKVGRAPRYDAVYINDPLQLKNFRAMFHIVGGYQPKFYCHSHFIDSPACPKFPQEASLWLGQCEAAIKADFNFWQCQSSLDEFEREAHKIYRNHVVDEIMAKSEPADDGYSQSEITLPVNEDNLRFTVDEWNEKVQGKAVLFFPNRISPSSGDYTNGMLWMFELLPRLRQRRQDFVVVCGNPNQKFTNKELEEKCGKNGYINLTPDSFNRDEYKFVAGHSDIALGFYSTDAYGGTASRECIELGCLPLWLDFAEYSSIAQEVGGYPYVIRTDLTDWLGVAISAIDHVKLYRELKRHPFSSERVYSPWQLKLRTVVRQRCSYESTVPRMMEKMNLL